MAALLRSCAATKYSMPWRLSSTIFSTFEATLAVESDVNQLNEQRRRIQEMIQAKSSAILHPLEPQSSIFWKNAQLKSQMDVLKDTFGRQHTYLRISLTEKCNLRCLYCMPPEGVDLTSKTKLLTSEELDRIVRLFVQCGIEKIRLTGGEPTIRSDIVDIVKNLSTIQGVKTIAMTTNGIVLERKLNALKAAGLDSLNISLDTLREDRFEAFTRRTGLKRVLAAIDRTIDMGFVPLKINVVVMKNKNEDEIPHFVEMTRNQPINVRFIEYMPFDGNQWSFSSLVPYKEMKQIVESHFGSLERCLDPKGEVAKNFRLPGFTGSVSFITSMTKAFCSECTRLRLMADGNLKICLFESKEFDLRESIRSGATDDELLELISKAVKTKKAAHAGMFELGHMRNRPMTRIGG